jgi:hypothetical protein
MGEKVATGRELRNASHPQFSSRKARTSALVQPILSSLPGEICP